MTTLVSRQNPRFKELKRLAERANARQRQGQTVLEGVHLCQAFLAKGGQPRLCVIGQHTQEHPEVAGICAQLSGVEQIDIDERLYRQLSQLGPGPALLFVIDVAEPPPILTLASDAVLLDRLQDPGNLGSILRSAAAAGFATVVLGKDSVSAWNPKVVRAAMGAHFSLTIHEDYDLERLMRGTSLPVYVTSSHQGRVLYDLPLDERACVWVFGNEGQGVRAPLLDLGQAVSIPQPGGEESLNVAAAAAVCLFETVRQRR